MFITVSDIQIEIERKFIKNMRLSVLPPDGKVHISAPMFLPEFVIISFINNKTDWIKKNQRKYKSSESLVNKNYSDGEKLYLWGKPYNIKIASCCRKKFIELKSSEVVLNIASNSTVLQRKKLVCEWYRALLKERINIRLSFWEDVMNLHCSSWQTKYMTSRWGTCNIKTKKIWLNVQLASKNPECLDYVIVHELAHLKERHHDKAFKAILNAYYPNWKEVQAKMNNQMES